MNIFLRIIIGIPAMLIGLLFIAKSYRVVQKIGTNNWAEQHFGGGGTYLLVKIVGMTVMLIAFLFILGIISADMFKF